MKRLSRILTLFILSLLLFACEEDTDSTIDVLVPNGTTSFSHAQIEHKHNDIVIDRVSGPNILISAFTSASHDIIIAPVNLGANLYNKGADYQLLGVLTWNNLQFISDEPIDTIYDLADKNIQAFGRGSTPEMILETLFQEADMTSQITIDYHAQSAQESYTHFTQNGGVALVAEPVTTMAKNNIDDLYVVDLAILWAELTEYNRFPQAGVFVKKSLSEDDITVYLDALTNNMDTLSTNPELIADYGHRLEYPFPKQIIEQSIPFSGIDFVPINNCKDEVNAFMETILTFNGQLINNEIPEQDFYYSKNE